MLQQAKFPVKEVPAIGVDSGREIDSTGYKFIVR